MEISGEFKIAASRQQVWEALNDPAVLQQAIPGCESMEKDADNAYIARVLSKIGPVKAKFNTKVTLTDLQPPQSYTLLGEGQGGVAGFAKGSASVNLTEEGAETVLRYNADFKVGGKLAQVGSRLVAGATRKMIDRFFSNFSKLMNPDQADEEAVTS